MIPAGEGAFNLAQVLADEAEEIRLQSQNPRRGLAWDLKLDEAAAQPSGETIDSSAAPASASAVPDRLGLAFSGGGIRSACVALGIVQRLAQARMLTQVHYICGISGGGYLLGWLTAWIKREGSIKWVEEQLGHSAASPPSAPATTGEPFAYKRFVEPYAIHYLRRYSSYLTPRVGLVSGDTLAMISVYLRNLLLNQTMLAMLAVSVMLVLQLLSPAIFWSHRISHAWMIVALVAFALIFSFGLYVGATALSRLGGSKSGAREPSSAASFTILSGVLACVLIWWMTPSWYAQFASEMATVIAVAIVVVAGTLVSAVLFRTRIDGDDLQAIDQASPSIVLLFAAWLVGGNLCCLLDWLFRRWLIHDTKVFIGDSYTILGLPCLLIGLAFVSYAFLGILGSKFPDPKREWLARVAGYFFLWAILFGGVAAIALRGPMLMHLLFTAWQTPSWKKYVISAVIPGGWLFIVATGLLGANSASSSGTPGHTSKLDVVVSIAPPVFLIGVLLLVSWGTHKIAVKTVPLPRNYLTMAEWRGPFAPTLTRIVTVPASAEPYKHAAPAPGTLSAHIRRWLPTWHHRYFVVWLLPTLIAALLAVRLDVNEFSLHLFYRNRLVRAFLGASNNLPNPRRPSPFTGFAPDDDIALEDLSRHSTTGKPYQGPYPIWGTTLNLTAGEDLAWQQRKGASFIYSPLFCGFDYVKSFTATEKPETAALDSDTDALARPKDRRMNHHGYRSTVGNKEAKIEGYGGIGGRPFIGTAMAASGAAVSPNMGYHTRPGVAALLALFNLRLGWWSGNPRSPSHWKRYAPGIWYLAAELLGHTGDKSHYVYLSDGGHFENLGVYELVRRKTRFIICSDADADPEFSFADLGNAIDRCRRDFGVEIHIRAQRDVCAEGGKQFRGGHYAIGEICYPGQTARGCLLYIKSSLTSDEPSDVLGMKASDSAFPHDTTANQFFNEAMFESYRALGEHMMDVILEKNGVSNDAASPRDAVAKLFTSLTAKVREQKEADKQPKPTPLAVAVAGGVTVHMDA